jgi:hypothetical protein
MRTVFISGAWFSAALLIGAMAGCGTPSNSLPPPTSPAAPAKSASSPAPVRVTLASEQVRLAELFRGTPVVFAMQSDGGLRVSVPLQYSFDRGSVVVKPPLAAVLDRLARSQLNQTTRLRLTAAADAGPPDPGLVQGRVQSTRDHLAGRGIAQSRMTLAGVARTAGVDIVVVDVP